MECTWWLLVFSTRLCLRKDHPRPSSKHFKSQIPHDFSSVQMKAENQLMRLKAPLCPLRLLCFTQENQLPALMSLSVPLWRPNHGLRTRTTDSLFCPLGLLHDVRTLRHPILLSQPLQMRKYILLLSFKVTVHFPLLARVRCLWLLYVFYLLMCCSGEQSELTHHWSPRGFILTLSEQWPRPSSQELTPKQALLPWERQPDLLTLLLQGADWFVAH